MDYSKINDVKELEKIIPKFSDAYYNGNPLVSDVIFDKLVDKLKEKKPNSLVLKRIGAPIRKDKKKVKLPIWMGSMDKMKPDTNELRLYFNRTKGPYLLSDKIDGAACLLEYKKGVLKNIYTRGDGSVGQDINFLKDYLNIPQELKIKNNLYVKGELSLTLKDYQNKFTEEATKPRGVVTGVYNSLEPDPNILKYLHFLAYELDILNEKDILLKPSQQFKALEKLKFETPHHKLVKEPKEILEKYLMERRKNSNYEIDGVIVASDYEYQAIKIDNPKHAIAFKVNEEGVESEVLDVVWEATKYGILFPVMKIKPVIVEGDTIKNISGKTAQFIIKNKIGKASRITVVKSGGVIPEIVEVLKSTKAEFPKIKYHWDENHVNIIMDNYLEDDLVKIKRILHFYTALEIKGLKIGNITKFYKGGLNSVDKINKAAIKTFMEIEGIKEKSATNIYNNIHKIIDKPIHLSKLMFASMCFDKGLGNRRFEMLLKELPKLYSLETPKKEDILNIEGFGEIVTDQFLEGFKEFKKFLKIHNYLTFSKPNNKIKKGKYNNYFILFSGFRDKNLEEELTKEGAVIEKNFNKKINLLIVDDINSSSNKLVKARENNIKIIEKSKLGSYA